MYWGKILLNIMEGGRFHYLIYLAKPVYLSVAINQDKLTYFCNWQSLKNFQ